MGTNDLKNIWSKNVDKAILSYSESELETMVLHSARKSIGKTYPGYLLTGGLLLLTSFCLWIGMKYIVSRPLWIFWVFSLMLLICFLAVSLWSKRKMLAYSFDKPLKEWIRSRIASLDKSIGLKKRYWFLLTYGVGFAILAVMCLLLITTADFSLGRTLVPFAAGFASVIVFAEIGRRKSIRRMIAARDRLQELYDQLDE